MPPEVDSERMYAGAGSSPLVTAASQNATAMYGCAAASAVTTTLTPLSEAPQPTNPAEMANQSAAGSQAASTPLSSLSAVPDALHRHASSGGPSQCLLNSMPVQSFQSLMFATSGYQNLFDAGGFVASGVTFLVAPVENPRVRSALIQSATAARIVAAAEVSEIPAGAQSAPVANGSPMASLSRSAASQAGVSGPPTTSPIGGVVNAPRRGPAVPTRGLQAQAGVYPSPKVRPPGDWQKFDAMEPAAQPSLSEPEELILLRLGNDELINERDLLKVSATLLIKQALRGSRGTH
ncbi:PPE family protein [Mycobacterium gordonae]|uniref:PPE family protein n=1 Tax=Mycobacterium gordonae TaxID=1778 RepID=UPI00210956F9|nr:PPE family protein [Mycobacterium gordonae]MCQ4365324.1 PPE family protein [Mycobacterium gordonae]